MPMVTPSSSATLASVIAPCASRLGTARSRRRRGMAEAGDDIQRGDEDFARRRLLPGGPAAPIERRAVQRGGEPLFATERRQGPTQRADSCSVFRHRLRINARVDRAPTEKKGNDQP